MPAVWRHVIAQQNNQIRVLLICQVDNPGEFLFVDKGPARVNVADDCDAQTALFLWPPLDLNCFLMDDEAIRLNEESIDAARKNQQRNDCGGDADSLDPDLMHIAGTEVIAC